MKAWLAVLLASDQQSVLHSAGPHAGSIEWLWWLFFIVCGAVYVIVLLALVYAVLHRRKKEDAIDPNPRIFSPTSEPGVMLVVGAAALLTLMTLVGFVVASVATDRKLTAMQQQEGALEIQLTGHQWWWEVTYPAHLPSATVRTANEIHIPVGRPVLLKLRSSDVIHSFWVPNLAGKQDLIPGRENTAFLQADAPGVFRGQCAEFCGYQHAHMALFVVAQPEEEFHAWLEQQRRLAVPPTSETARRGQQVFLNSQCALCHTVRGTRAGGQLGPDLTHLASRSHIAAGTLPNTRGNLAGWVVDPQKIKPGNRMPQNSLTSEQLHDLLDYLETLQ